MNKLINIKTGGGQRIKIRAPEAVVYANGFKSA